METSINEIAAALAKAQTEMVGAKKDTANPFFKNKYADLSSVVAACLHALNKNGIAVVQPVTDVAVETWLIHSSGQSLKCSVPLRVAKDDMQALGSAITYARRYGLMCMAGVSPEDDDGNAAAKAPPKKEPKPEAEAAQKAVEYLSEAEAAQKAVEYLSEAESLDDLKARWDRIPKPITSGAAVIAAKDAAKKRLNQKPPADALNGDHIPY